MRNLQEQVKKAFCYQKLFWPFTVWINCSSDLKNFANSQPSASNFKSFSQSLEQFCLTKGQNNFEMGGQSCQIHNSILLHSGLNPAWHFWLSTRFSCCLKMKSVENILGYIREQFYRFSRGCKPRENLWNCSRKYTKMFKTDSFLGNKKLSLNQNVWRDHATMQQDVLLHFWVIFLHWNQAKIWNKYSVVQL